ncbi:MAG: 5-formyltetrahydrofolate cyclo-ligase [Clostridiales bacterium]|nr:5-formyltetrahydrofolate cyclo-ligase [Clostridiales bacterium]
MNTKEYKRNIRKEVLMKRSKMKAEEKELKDNIILEKLFETNLYKNARNIFTYISFGDEINTIKLIERALKDNKNISVPKTYRETRTMNAIFIPCLKELKENHMGILEPIDDSIVIKKEDIDLIIVPGAVFDKDFNRIGYGGGYYDRYLEDIAYKNNKVVLAYDFQIVDKIEKEEHDVKVDIIITDKQILTK